MKKYLLIASFVLAVAGILVANNSFANPSYFVPTVQTATATTSITYLAPNATTTLTFDSYLYTPKAVDGATLLVRHVASTTASVMTARYEYSQDGVDWYTDFASRSLVNGGSTSTVGTHSFTFTGNTTSSTTLTAVPLSTPTRYVRINFIGTTASSGVWAQIVPLREHN